MYIYNTPINAILSLEAAYTNKDINGVIQSKDFIREAIFILQEVSNKYNIEDEDLVKETAELLKLSLIKSLQADGFPNFSNAKREFSELQKIDTETFCLDEIISYENDEVYNNKYYLSKNGELWKIITVK